MPELPASTPCCCAPEGLFFICVPYRQSSLPSANVHNLSNFQNLNLFSQSSFINEQNSVCCFRIADSETIYPSRIFLIPHLLETEFPLPKVTDLTYFLSPKFPLEFSTTTINLSTGIHCLLLISVFARCFILCPRYQYTLARSSVRCQSLPSLRGKGSKLSVFGYSQ